MVVTLVSLLLLEFTFPIISTFPIFPDACVPLPVRPLRTPPPPPYFDPIQPQPTLFDPMPGSPDSAGWGGMLRASAEGRNFLPSR
jgi:hypothetical protein